MSDFCSGEIDFWTKCPEVTLCPKYSLFVPNLLKSPGTEQGHSKDCDDGIEYSACLHDPSPRGLLDRKKIFYRLWNALNSLPEVQGRRVDAHLILGKSYRQIAREEGVDKSDVRCSVESGIKRMKSILILGTL